MIRVHRSVTKGSEVLGRRFVALLGRPVFWVITILGNLTIFLGSFLLFAIESPVNPRLNTWVDALYWGFSTVTTVGYGDIVPITQLGKIVAIGVMLVGTCFFWGYTALFASALLLPDLEEVDKKLEKIEREIEKAD